jgi:hypothetical protein
VEERRILTRQEVIEVDRALSAVYSEYARLRELRPAARHIHRPGIPSIFSESLIAGAASAILGEDATAGFGGSAADLRVIRAGKPDLLVEVKASGKHGWQEIKERDLERDFFVWVAFGDRYESGEGPIDVFALPEPSRYRPPRRKLTLPVFLAGASPLPGFRAMRFGGVESMLDGGRSSALPHQVAQQSLEVGVGALGGLD